MWLLGYTRYSGLFSFFFILHSFFFLYMRWCPVQYSHCNHTPPRVYLYNNGVFESNVLEIINNEQIENQTRVYKSSIFFYFNKKTTSNFINLDSNVENRIE
jgi:hypothetical protein